MVTLKFMDAFDEGHIEITSHNNDATPVIILDAFDEGLGEACICLDKSTAIKFSKELRKQIALLD